MPVPGLILPPGLITPSGLKVRAVLGDQRSTGSNITSYSPTISIGDVPNTLIGETRDIYLIIESSNNYPSTVEFDVLGITFTLLYTVPTGPRHRVYYARVNNAVTTAHLSITWSGTQYYMGMAAFSVYNLRNPTEPTIYTASGGSGITKTITTKVNGAVIASIGCSLSSGSRTSTWTGLDEAWDVTTQSGDNYYSGALLEHTDVEQSLDVVWTPSAATSTNGMGILVLD